MFYGVKCREFDEYVIIERDNVDELFTEFGCEAVFDDINNAEVYKNWLEAI